MSWLLIFVSALIPILLLAVIVVEESLRHDRAKLCTVRVPLGGTERMRMTDR
jgi:hypothetical protein